MPQEHNFTTLSLSPLYLPYPLNLSISWNWRYSCHLANRLRPYVIVNKSILYLSDVFKQTAYIFLVAFGSSNYNGILYIAVTWIIKPSMSSAWHCVQWVQSARQRWVAISPAKSKSFLSRQMLISRRRWDISIIHCNLIPTTLLNWTELNRCISCSALPAAKERLLT